MRLFIFLIAILISKSSCDSVVLESKAIQLISCEDKTRNTIGKITEVEAIVTFLDNDGSIIVLVPNTDKTKRYVACNLPKEVALNDGTSIVFSGDVKEIRSNERLAGTPVELTELKLKMIK